MGADRENVTGEGGFYEPERLDLSELARMLRERRGSLSIRQAAADAGVSFSTFSRVEAGAHPDLATFTQICAWLRVSPTIFFNPVTERERSHLDEAITHLRSDPRLDPNARSKLTTMLADLYNALAQDPPSTKPVVACHLRAASVMRPGVPQRMAGLLTDMRQELVKRFEAGHL